MVETIIIKYLQNNRRLVVPKLGAFIVKEDNQSVLFSELLRGDDGVLRGLIKAHGVGDIEAAGVIDRFVFEVRHTLDRNMPYKIGNWGILRRDDKGKIVFMSFRTPTQQAAVRTAPNMQQPVIATTPAPSGRGVAEPANVAKPSDDAPKRSASRRKPDIFMIVAVVVAVVAICAIAYGVLCNGGGEAEEPMPFPEMENVEGFDAIDGESGGEETSNAMSQR